jgi:two-component system OmpR family sensor kinase
MWATPSPSTSRLLLAGWVLFAGLNVVLMHLFPEQDTVPFHLVWISLTLVYGFTSWRTTHMVVALLAVVTSTGATLGYHAQTGVISWQETSEVPLMAAIFGVMAWHVRRRQESLREVQRISELDRRRHEARELFVRLASHELRTPITVARGYAEMIRDAHQDPQTVEDTAVVLEELDKVSGITRRLLTLMQVDQPHPLTRCDIDAALKRIVRRWQPTADRDWVLRSDIGSGLLNRERFEAALDCLLENAVKFTRTDGRVEVTGERGRDHWWVRVRDDGCGMSRETSEQLVTAPPGRRTTTGSGLGLAIVRAVVASMRGHMTVSSEPGRGTTITLQIPHTPSLPVHPVPTTASANVTGEAVWSGAEPS